MNDTIKIANLYFNSIKTPNVLTERIHPDYNHNQNLNQLMELYQYDIKCISELINEGFFDKVAGFFSKPKESPANTTPTTENETPEQKQKSSGIFAFAKDKIINKIVKIIVDGIRDLAKAGKLDVLELAEKMREYERNPNSIKNAANQFLKQQSVQESYIHSFSNKDFLLENVFSKSELNLFLDNLILEKKITTNQNPQELAKFAVDSLSKYTQRNRNTRLKSFQDLLDKEANSKFGTPPEEDKTLEPESPDETDSSTKSEATPENKQGIVSKIMGWLRSHPNITSASLSILIGVAAYLSGGTTLLYPLIIKGLYGAGIGGGFSAILQKYKNKEKDIDWKSVFGAALKGFGFGMLGGGLLNAAGAVGLTGLGAKTATALTMGATKTALS